MNGKYSKRPKGEDMEMSEVGTPAELLEAWSTKDLKAFKRILEEGCDPNFIFPDTLRPILAIIAKDLDPRVKEFADVLLATSVDRDKQYCSGNCAIHIAAEVGNLPIIKSLVEGKADLNSLDQSGNTALHILAKQKWKKDDLSHRNCVEFLLAQENIKLNVINNLGFTPIHFAARFKNRDAIMALLEKGSLLDIDSFAVGIDKVTPREAILKLDPSLEKDLPLKLGTEAIKMDCDKLFNLLYTDKVDRFCDAFNREMQDKSQRKLLLESNGSLTLLQYACDKNMVKVVEVLLSHGADVNFGAHESISPAIIAVKKGHHEIFALLLEKNCDIQPDHRLESVLHYIAKHCKDSEPHFKCLELLLDKYGANGVDVNVQDVLGNTPLHYAVLYADDRTVMKLLKKGAYIGMKNKDNETPLLRLSSQVFGEFLDSNLEGKGKHLFDEDYLVKFNYGFLRPPRSKPNSKDEAILLTNEHDTINFSENSYYQCTSETEPLKIMIQKKDLRTLLNHPVLTSFTFLKWQRIRAFYYTNLFFYLTFCILLSAYIIFGYRTLVLHEAAPTNTVEGVLKENVGLHDKVNYSKPVHEIVAEDSSIATDIIRIIILLFLVFLSARELFQFVVNIKSYVCNLENWLELLLIGVATTLVVKDCPQALSGQLGYICPQLCAIAVLVSWIELVLLIGKHPKYSIQVEMFRKVSISFAMFLSWYVLLIVAFALSFFVLFRGCGSDCEDSNPFTNPGTSIFKTIVMLTGEFESGDIPFLSYIGTSHIIFIAFVFLIAIVLLNLLNGLAVADTKVIRDESYLYTCIARVRLIVFIEDIVLGRTLSIFQPVLCLCSGVFGPNFKCSVFEYFARNLKFFPTLLPENAINVFPNDGNRIEFIGRKRRGGNACEKEEKCITKYFIDNETMTEVRQIINETSVKILPKDNDDLTLTVKSCVDEIESLRKFVSDVEARLEQSHKQLEQLLIQNIALTSNLANSEGR